MLVAMGASCTPPRSQSALRRPHRRTTVALRDFDRLCVIMTRQAKKQGVDGRDILAAVATRCDEESPYVPSDAVP
jgi:hypothetical protein